MNAPDSTAVPSDLSWNAVTALRKTARTELLAQRAALGVRERQRRGASVHARLLAELELSRYHVLGMYWPIRGELDLRDFGREHLAAGGVVALPVVTRKNAPVEFWQWQPDTPMHVGAWNIPVPAERRLVLPDALLIPLVGFDSAGYRLGYGGGYYDRTLAASTPRPFCVGVGYAEAELATIHPQPHDVPMHRIVTDKRAFAV